MRCKHPRSGRRFLNLADWDCCYKCNICRRCGERLSLGPSNDEPPEVQIEIRAAELTELASTSPTRFRLEHSAVVSLAGRGWWVHQMDLIDADEVTHLPEALAGYLARCIVTHEEST